MSPAARRRIAKMAPHVDALDDAVVALRALAKLTPEQARIATVGDAGAYVALQGAVAESRAALRALGPMIAECERACEQAMDEALS